MKKVLLLLLWALICPQLAFAQGPVSVCYFNGQGGCSPAIQGANSAIIAISSATTTQLVALISGKQIFVTNWNVVSSAAGTVKLVYGTGTNCGTGTTDLTGTYTLGTSTVLNIGIGLGPILTVPRSNALCFTSTGSIAAQGTVSYNQF